MNVCAQKRLEGAFTDENGLSDFSVPRSCLLQRVLAVFDIFEKKMYIYPLFFKYIYAYMQILA